MWELTPKQKGDYTRLYEYILPKTVKALDPQTYYWPSSPSSGGDFDNPSDETRGDVTTGTFGTAACRLRTTATTISAMFPSLASRRSRR